MIQVYIRNNLKSKTVIVDENMTVREALEANEIDYSMATPMLDGTALRSEELDTSFADLGVNDHCYLICAVKAQNAAVAVAGDIVVISSKLKYDEIQEVEKFDPEKLQLLDDEKNPIFAIGTTTRGNGSISKFGITFSAKNAEGLACVSVALPQGVENVKTWIADKYGAAIRKLTVLEEQVAKAAASVAEDRKALVDSITVL